MRKAKVIETEDGELAIQLTDEEMESLNWKVGDDIEWSETENGFKLTKVDNEPSEIYKLPESFNEVAEYNAEDEDKGFYLEYDASDPTCN